MKEWWNAREPREQRLLQFAGLLLISVAVLQFLILPLVRSKSDKMERNVESMQTLDVLTSLKEVDKQQRSEKSRLSNSELRIAALSLASDRGLAISRIQEPNDNEMTMVLDKASPEIFYAWLEDLQEKHGARPTNISMMGDTSSGVRASVAFKDDS